MGSDKNVEIVRSGFKSSLCACAHLMPDWMNRVREDYKEEMCCGAHSWPIQLLRSQSRVAVWNVARELNVAASGVAPLACRLMERYLAVQLRHNNTAPAESLEIERFQHGLSSRIPVLIATCVQIAAKSLSATMSLPAAQVCSYLNRKGTKHAIKDIVTWEYHVFQTIGYRVPLWTSVEIAELLATQARLGPAALQGLAVVVSFAELKRDEVDRRVRWAANLSSTSSGSSGGSGDTRSGALAVRTVHLAAGAVAACARYFAPPAPAPDLERRLAAATDAPRAFIECVRDSILTVTVLDDYDDRPKRRRLD